MPYFNRTKFAITLRASIAAGIAVAVFGCSTGEKKEAHEATGGGSDSGSGGANGDSNLVSGERHLLVNSLSNNGFTSQTVNRAKAAGLSTSLSANKSRDAQTNYGIIVANRIAGKPPNDSFDEARSMVDRMLAKNPDAELPEIVQLELALAALHVNKLALAEFYLEKLTKSKTPRIAASAINALGVVAIRMDRIPEAVATFKEALAIDKDYRPALLNIGFLALQGGDASTAKRALGGMQDDWAVDGGLISVERLEGDSDKAEQRCERVLSKHPRHKPTLINCGINAYQGRKDYKKARDYLNRALAVQGGSALWDEKSGRLLGVVDAEEARAGQMKAAREAEERAAKAQADKAKADAAAGKAPGAAAPGQPANGKPAGAQ